MRLNKTILMASRLVKQLGKHINEEAMRRFIPYIQFYEFEGLLFSDPKSMASEIGKPSLEGSFIGIRDKFETPEHVNNSNITAPSKRIKVVFSQYDKVIHGSLIIALKIGINTICEECHLFDAWVNRLKTVE